MKVLQINIFGNLSTGRIASEICKTLYENGEEGVLAFARNNTDSGIKSIRIGTDLDVKIHGVMTRITDKTGFYSSNATKKLVEEIKAYRPDIIHLHNIHGYYINIEILFNYLKSTHIPVVWTLHDCWAYTGHCCYYSVANCLRWKTGCYECPQKGAYPASILMDNSKWNYKKKKELFNSIKMTLVPVSKWLAEEVHYSFLNKQPMKVIYNGIDLDTFKPTESKFKEKHGILGKKIVLGVASTWDVRKGLKDFVKLSEMLDDSWKVVVVGVNDDELKSLPNCMIGVKRTNSVQELAEIYSAADVFFNASVEETFGLPTVEAMACGTPAIVYDTTALPEVVNESCGFVVKPHDLKSVVDITRYIDKEKMSRACIANAVQFDCKKKYFEYVELYRSLLNNNSGVV